MTTFRALAALLALSSVACSSPGETERRTEAMGEQSSEAFIVVPRPPALTVCLYDVSDAARLEVERGVLGWARALAPWRDVVIGEAGCNLTVFEVGAHAGICDDDSAGCVTQIGGLEAEVPDTELFLYRGEYEAYAAGTVMHEIGHLLGLTHSDAGLMRAGWDEDYQDAEWECPDPETTERLERALSFDGLAPCPLPAGIDE